MLLHAVAALILNAPPAMPMSDSTATAPPKVDAKHQADIDRDTRLGGEYAKEVAKEFKFTTKKDYQERVEKIGNEIAAVANGMQAIATWGDKRFSPFQYKFFVIQQNDPNAFSLPGGYIYVNEGLLDYAESDDELAGVLAHEIAHAAFRHVPTLEKEQSRVGLLQLPLILAVILSGGRSGTGEILMGSQLLNQALTSGWSVKAEQAADYGGFQYLQKTKYNPTGLLTFMERLARDERALRGVEQGIYRTHPPGRERAESLTGYLTKAGIPIQRSQVTITFRTVAKKLDDGSYDAFFGKKKIFTFRGKSAEARVNEAVVRLNAFFDGVPELYEVNVTSDGSVLGKGRLLFRAEPEDVKDVKDPKTSPAQLADGAARAIKDSLFSLAFRVWDARN